MLNFARNQLKYSEKWGFEPCAEYANPIFMLTNRRKRRRLESYNRWHCHREQTVHDLGSADFPGGRGRCQEYSVASLNMKNLMSPTPRN